MKDVLERHKILNEDEVLEILLDVLDSSIGSLANPSELSNAFKSERRFGTMSRGESTLELPPSIITLIPDCEMQDWGSGRWRKLI